MSVLGRATDHEYAHKVVVRRVGADFVVVRAGRASDGDSVAKLSLAVLLRRMLLLLLTGAKPARLAREPAGSQPARYDARALSRHRRPLHRWHADTSMANIATATSTTSGIGRRRRSLGITGER